MLFYINILLTQYIEGYTYHVLGALGNMHTSLVVAGSAFVVVQWLGSKQAVWMRILVVGGGERARMLVGGRRGFFVLCFLFPTACMCHRMNDSQNGWRNSQHTRLDSYAHT